MPAALVQRKSCSRRFAAGAAFRTVNAVTRPLRLSSDAAGRRSAGRFRQLRSDRQTRDGPGEPPGPGRKQSNLTWNRKILTNPLVRRASRTRGDMICPNFNGGNRNSGAGWPRHCALLHWKLEGCWILLVTDRDPERADYIRARPRRAQARRGNSPVPVVSALN